MILIDTKVLSELWKAEPHPAVLAWIDAQPIETLCLSAITVAELWFGLATMPLGQRRTIFQTRWANEVLPAFAGRVLPFDLGAAQAYGDLMARARQAGKAIAMANGCIAATAAAHRLMVATRDTGPFEAAGLKVINPWEPAR